MLIIAGMHHYRAVALDAKTGRPLRMIQLKRRDAESTVAPRPVYFVEDCLRLESIYINGMVWRLQQTV